MQLIEKINILWITAGLGCDGESVALTAATQPGIEDIVLGGLPGLPPVRFLNPFYSYENAGEYLHYLTLAQQGQLDPFILVLEGSLPNEDIKEEGYWAALGTDPATGQPITTCAWLDRLAPHAWAVMAVGTCATYGGIHAMEGNPTGARGLPDYLGWDWQSKAGVPIVCVPGCPTQPDNLTETLLYLLYQAAGRAPMIKLDESLRPTWLFGATVHEGCNRAGYYEQGQFAESYGSPHCIVKLGCWGPVVNCNVGKRGWVGGIGGCPNVGGICIGCTMPGFPDKFMPFMNQPPGSLLSSHAVMIYGRAIHALRRYTQASLNQEPAWRMKGRQRLSGYFPPASVAPEDFAARVLHPGDAVHNESTPPAVPAAENILTQLEGVFFSVTDTADSAPQAPFARELPSVTETYRILVEQIPAVVFIAFFDKGLGEAYVSPQIEAALGFTQEEWLNEPVRWYHQIHPDDKARWSIEAAEMLLTGEPLRSVYRVLARDGRVVWFQCEVKVVRQEDGRPWFIHGLGFDITELKHAEEALGKSEEMLRGIFEHAPDTMIVVNSAGRIERVNGQVERMFGYRREELLGQSVEILIAEHARKRHAKHRANYVADPHLRPMGAGLALHGRRKDGSEFPVDIMLSPASDEAHNLVIAVIRDITQRQQNEKALRENAERMKILSRRLIEVQEAERRSIALELHDEIGQILTGLKLTLEMSARLPEGEARASVAGAQALVNELMTRTRQLSLNLRPATLDHLGLLSALLRHIRQYYSQTQVRVDFRHDGLEGRRFAPDIETAAFRIVQEALTNVARHSGADQAAVRIWADHNALTVQVEDTGRGFDPDAILARSQSSGLSGMRDRALLLGGNFTVDAYPGGGTRLTAEWYLDDDNLEGPPHDAPAGS